MQSRLWTNILSGARIQVSLVHCFYSKSLSVKFIKDIIIHYLGFYFYYEAILEIFVYKSVNLKIEASEETV